MLCCVMCSRQDVRFAMLNDEFEYYDNKRQFSTNAVRNFAALSDDNEDSDLMRKDMDGNILPGRCAPRPKFALASC